MPDLGPLFEAITAGQCLGCTGPGHATPAHTAPVPLERNEALAGWWCPVCRCSLAVTDEMMERTRARPATP